MQSRYYIITKNKPKKRASKMATTIEDATKDKLPSINEVATAMVKDKYLEFSTVEEAKQFLLHTLMNAKS
jgi:hypothetical protein